MAPIPSTEQPGHSAIRDRADAALDLLTENRSIEFKRSEGWDVLKFDIVRSAMAMANQRDGGIIVIGVAEDDEWRIDGLLEGDLSTFDVDTIEATVAKYASPCPSHQVVLHSRDDKCLLVVSIEEFDEGPVLCKRDYPKELRQGAIYLRQDHPARTEAPRDHEQIRAVVELAAEKRTRAFIAEAGRVGTFQDEDKPSDAAAFDAELKELLP